MNPKKVAIENEDEIQGEGLPIPVEAETEEPTVNEGTNVEDTADKVEEKIEGQKPFLEIEPAAGRIDPLIVYNKNPRYGYRWCAKNRMASNRSGIWHTLPKDHPDFSEVKVLIDHTQSENFFTYKDLILCCARIETVEAARKELQERVKSRDRKMDEADRETIGRIRKDGIKALS
jgi:hypothetical protein